MELKTNHNLVRVNDEGTIKKACKNNKMIPHLNNYFPSKQYKGTMANLYLCLLTFDDKNSHGQGMKGHENQQGGHHGYEKSMQAGKCRH